jgi:hypothetical protein
MEKETLILQELFIPVLQKDERFEESKCDSLFWNKITAEFINYEQDKKPFYASIYSLELVNVEQVINELESLLNPFLDYLAESYVQGYSSDTTQKLSMVSHYFNERVLFYNNLKKAIFLSERKRIKSELPSMFEKYTFEIDEKQLVEGITKIERQALRDKMKVWDEELIKRKPDIIKFSLAETETKSSSSNDDIIKFLRAETETKSSFDDEIKNDKVKIISLQWIKYAVAACIFFTVGVIYFNTDNNVVRPTNNKVVTAPVKKDTSSKSSITPKIPSEALAEMSSVTKNATVIESSLGFASKEKKIKIIENNQSARMQSIVIAIDKYRKFLENEFSENKVGYGPYVKELETKIKALQKELALLKQRDNHYIFDGKELVLYISSPAKENAIVLYEDKYYLKRDADFFSLTITKKLQVKEKVIDLAVVEVLNNLYFN